MQENKDEEKKDEEEDKEEEENEDVEQENVEVILKNSMSGIPYMQMVISVMIHGN